MNLTNMRIYTTAQNKLENRYDSVRSDSFPKSILKYQPKGEGSLRPCLKLEKDLVL
jgi:hypothetical protein